MTDRILEFLRNRREDGPCLVLDLDVVRDNYASFAKALPDTRVFYAVKANPDPRVLELLARLGSCFDTASVVEWAGGEVSVIEGEPENIKITSPEDLDRARRIAASRGD